MNSGDRAGQGVGIAHGNGECPYGGQVMRPVGYVRVSTDRQVDVGAGLGVQRKAVRVLVPTGAIE